MSMMGEKEFFEVMKSNNQHLTMQERFLIAEIINNFICIKCIEHRNR